MSLTALNLSRCEGGWLASSPSVSVDASVSVDEVLSELDVLVAKLNPGAAGHGTSGALGVPLSRGERLTEGGDGGGASPPRPATRRPCRRAEEGEGCDGGDVAPSTALSLCPRNNRGERRSGNIPSANMPSDTALSLPRPSGTGERRREGVDGGDVALARAQEGARSRVID
jgi:hypothetical protein